MIAFMTLCLLTAYSVVADKLVSVQVLFRHGDRAPSSPYPKDLYNAKHWPNGWSQLTEVRRLICVDECNFLFFSEDKTKPSNLASSCATDMDTNTDSFQKFTIRKRYLIYLSRRLCSCFFDFPLQA